MTESTTRRGAEKLLQEPTPDFRAIFDSLPSPHVVFLPDAPAYTIVAANQAFMDAMSATPAKLIGHPLFDLWNRKGDERGTGELCDSLRRVLTTKTADILPAQEYEIFRGDGDDTGGRYGSLAITPLLGMDREIRFIDLRFDDATDAAGPLSAAESRRIAGELRRTEQKLLAMEARYGLAFAKAPIGMVLLAPDGKILELNQAYIDSLGYTREELISRDTSFFTHPDDVELTREFFVQLQTGAHDTASIEKRYFRKNGEILWARASASMRRDETGKPVEVIAIVEDITKRKRAEKNLWESRAQLRTVYDGTHEYMGLLALDGTVLDCNRASLEFAGNSREDVIGLRFWETPWFAHTAGAPEVIRQGIARAAAGQFVRDEVTLRRPSGEMMTFDFSLHPVRNERGDVVFLVPEGRDITEQHQAARRIEEDRGRWRELLRQTPAAIALLHGPEHRYEWVNPAYESVVGRTAAVMIGKTVLEAIPELDGQAFIELLDGVYRTGEPAVGHEAPARLIFEDGGRRDLYVDFVYLPVRDSQARIDGIFVHVTDVTGAVLARKQLEDSERQFRTLAETIPHLAWMADDTGNIFWYNRRWYEYTGTTLPEIEGWRWQVVHDPAVLPEVLTNWKRAIATGEPFEMVFPLRGASGDFRMFLTRVEPVRDMAGRVVRWFGTNTDITDQRKTEEELRRMNRELEEFAYVASHDMQEPLRMVNIYTQMILRTPASEKTKLDHYSVFVREGVERMQALIQDLLSFSRAAHNWEPVTGASDLSVALAEALSVLKGRIEESGATVNAPVLPIVRGDASQLAHVFQNILANAIKYRKENVPPLIDISAQRDGDSWIVSIRDNGIGFEPQYAERIFGLFKRLHKDEYPGTGLGLAICKRIVERCGGRMWARGEPGVGTTIGFSLTAAGEQ